MGAALIGLAAAAGLGAAVPAGAVACAELAGTGGVTAAAVVAAGAAPWRQKDEFCRVQITARPSAGSDVRIELWIPAAGSWNGKFLQVGNGGFAGQIPYRSLGFGLADGYAVAGTDNGHQTSDSTDARWALGHPEKVVDFGWRAVKATTDAARAVLARYGAVPRRAYFAGCSDGGREALMTAQRYPLDFDGIIAGAPAADWSGLMASAGLIAQDMAKAGRALPAAKLPALQAAALKACGRGASWVAQPNACRFDPVVLRCKGKVTNQCLTRGEVETVRTVYAGRRNPATGVWLPGLRPGAEKAWAGWLVPDDQSRTEQGFAPSYFANLVRQDPGFRISSLTPDDLAKSEREVAPILNATNPDLSPFKARGGRLIQYHGWNDPAIAPDHSLAYAAAVAARTPGAGEFYRLYMVPGMLHCGGGAAPSRVDWLAALDAWVERGSAPGTVDAAADDGTSQALNPQPLPPAGTARSR